MDFAMNRRAGGTKYGKNRGKVLGYDFFTNDSKSISNSIATAPPKALVDKLPLSPSSASSESSSPHEPTVPAISVSPSPSISAKPAHVTSHSRSSVSVSTDSRSTSPVKQTSGLPAKPDASTFDILSSEDDLEMKTPRPLKRRKITQAVKESKPETINVENTRAQELPQSKRLALAKSQGRIASMRAKADTKPGHEFNKARERAIANNLNVSDLSETQTPAKVKSKTRLKKSTYAKRPNQATNIETDNGEALIGPVEDVELQPNPSKKARTFVKTKTEDAQTPRKQLHHWTDSEASVASPGSIGFNDLRLTPERNFAHQPSPDSASPTATPQHRGRLRRIDMLDAPKEPSSKPSTRAPSATGSLHGAKRLLSEEISHHLVQAKSDGQGLARSGSSQGRQGYGRARNTYGKERSHLADMVDSLDVLSNKSSQETSQDFASQLAATSAPSHLQMELEFDDSSSDDAVPGMKLKSIHELRQAGSNDRFERDLEGLLGDIDPNPKDASKSSRLPACMKLFGRLSQETFAVFVSDRGLDRLVEWSKILKDKISKLLLNLILWRLTHTKNTSAAKMKSIFQATASSTALITDLGTMAHMAKSRRENLPKQTIRDLQYFEDNLLRDQLLPAYEGTSIIPAAVMLSTLHDSLRKLIDFGASGVVITGPSYKNVLLILRQASQSVGMEGISKRYILKTTLSLLKIFTGLLEDDPDLSEAECMELGSTLASVVNEVYVHHEDLLQLVFHFVISLCNGRPEIHHPLSLTNLSSSTMIVVDARFIQLIDSAESGTEVQPVMLDSIILGLACLSIPAEYDREVRLRFANTIFSSSNVTNLEKLLEIYTRMEPRLANATTVEKGPALIALGHLSLLICNLCREDVLWRKAAQVLSGASYSVADIVATAKQLVIHLKALETELMEMQVDGADESGADFSTPVSMDGFVARSITILEDVRIS